MPKYSNSPEENRQLVLDGIKDLDDSLNAKSKQIMVTLGRPPRPYEPRIGDLICAHLAQGWSYRKIEQCFSEVPCFHVLSKWLMNNESFANQYKEARLLQADALLDDIMDIVDNADVDSKAGILKARVQIQARQWVAGKLNPKKYGKPEDTIASRNSDNSINILVDASRQETREEWEARRKKELEDRSTATIDAEIVK